MLVDGKHSVFRDFLHSQRAVGPPRTSTGSGRKGSALYWAGPWAGKSVSSETDFRYTIPWKVASKSPASLRTLTSKLASFGELLTSRDSAINLPAVAHLKIKIDELMDSACCPRELLAAANAKSARVKSAPP